MRQLRSRTPPAKPRRLPSATSRDCSNPIVPRRSSASSPRRLSSRFPPKQSIEFSSRIRLYAAVSACRRPARRKVFAKVESFLVHYALGHRLAALVVVRRVVKIAVAAAVDGTPASRALSAEADSLSGVDLVAALPASH